MAGWKPFEQGKELAWRIAERLVTKAYLLDDRMKSWDTDDHPAERRDGGMPVSSLRWFGSSYAHPSSGCP